MVFQSNSFSSQPRAASGSKSTVLLARNLPSIPGEVPVVAPKAAVPPQVKTQLPLPSPTPRHEFFSALPQPASSGEAKILGFQRHSPFKQHLKTKSVPLGSLIRPTVEAQENSLANLPPQFGQLHGQMSVKESIKQTSPFITSGATSSPRVTPPHSWVDPEKRNLLTSAGQPQTDRPVSTNFMGQKPSNSVSGYSKPPTKPPKKRSKKAAATLAVVAGLVLALWLTPASAWRSFEKGLIGFLDGQAASQQEQPTGGRVAGANSGEVKGLTTEFPNSQRLVISLPTVFRQAVVMTTATIQDLLNIEGDVNVGGDLAVDGATELGGETTVGGAATFEDTVNIAGEVTLDGDVTGNDIDIDIGSGTLTASNVVYTVTAGDGISSSGGQNPVISNTDRGSAQKIFGKVLVDTTTISAGNNTDTLEFIGGTGVTLTPNTTDKSITIDVSGSAVNVSGWTDDGSTVRLTTIGDAVGIGTATVTSGNKLSLVGNSDFTGNLAISGLTTSGTMTVGTSTLTSGSAFSVLGDGDITGDLLVSGTLTVQSGSIVSGGINNQSGGITNAGAITGATGLTSSGTITFSGLSTGIVKSSLAGVLSSSAVNLGSADITGTLGPTNGGTGLSTYTTGDLIYASATNTLSKLAAGADDQVLTLASGIPTWASITGSGGLCSNCVVTDPASTQVITPTASTATGLSVRQASSGSVDIFNVASNNGSAVYFRVDSSGNVLLGSGSVSSGGVLTVGPSGTDPITISPVAQGAGAFTGTITSADLTATRTWTLPDATGTFCLSTGNCIGSGGNLGGSGTIGYIPRFDSTSTITNSVMFDDGTNVGISDATPSYKLDVNGTFRATGAGTFDSSLAVTGNQTVGGTLQTTGAGSFLSTLDVTGATTLSSTLGVTGNTTLGGTLTVANNVTVDTNTFFIDTVGNRVAVGDLTPDAKFDIDSDETTGNSFGIASSTQTSGNMVNVSSTSNALTTGKLASYDWSPSSTTTATGDLFNINIGTNGSTTGNLFSISDTGSALFSVSESQITAALPTQFTAPGDVGFAYDVMFTNQTASYIRSKAPLYLEAGEVFESNDLTLRTYNVGDVNIDLTGTGRMNLTGTDTSMVFDTRTATDTDFWMGIQDDGGGDDDDVFQIGDGTTPGTNPFVTINTSGYVGIGNTTPLYPLSIASTGTAQIFLDNSTPASNNGYQIGQNTSKELIITGGGSSNTSAFFNPSGSSTPRLYVGLSSARTGVGVGTTASDRAFEVNSATGSNLRLTYNDSDGSAANYTDFTTGSNGALTITSTGALNLQPDGAIDVTIAGGSGATGCTVTNSTGDLTCTGSITGSSSGTMGYWSRSGTSVSPATITDSVGIGDATPDAILDVDSTATTGNAFGVLSSTQTSGNLLNISSTSTALTTGKLASYDWSPGSATTATGDLFNINIGTNGTTTGNLFSISDTGTNLFTVSESQVTSNLPVNFTSPGDVTMGYNLLFSNPTASYIRSQAPLYLEAGETFGSSDLTLRTYNAGDVNVDLTGTGRVNLTGTDTSMVFDTRTATDTDFWMGVQDDGGADDDDTFQIGDGTTPGTNPFVTINTSGNVGIGTVSPIATLDIQRAPGTVLGSSLQMYVGGGNGTATHLYQIGFGKGSVTQASSIIGAQNMTGSANGYSDLFFATRNVTTDTAPTERMRITSSGTVGIGTTTPGQALEINSATGSNLRLTYNDADGSATAYTDFTLASDGDLTVNSAGGNLNFQTAATTELSLSSTNLTPGTAEGNSLGSATAEWEQLFLGDDAGLSLGLDQDWSLAYDEATDDRLELTTAGVTGLAIQSATLTGTGTQFLFDSVTTGTGVAISADALTTGKGFYVESTSTAFSSGSLGSLYWNPGSTTTATGDVLTLDVGANGIVGSIFNVKNAGSSVFSVGQAQITSAVPHQFTAAGDIAAAYDLQFTNQTASYIKSYAPLYLEAGETFESNDLTLRTYNSGNLIADLTGTGKFRMTGTDASMIFDTRTGTDTDFWMGIQDDGGGDDDDIFQIGKGTTAGTTPYVTINSSGNFGIGNNAPAIKLHVGDASVTDSTALLRLQDTNSTCDFTADTGSPSCGSDETLKKNIASLDTTDLLAKVAALRPVSYNWKTDGDNAPVINGFIAQEVAAQFPDLVTERTWIDGTTRKFLNTGGLMPYVVGAVGEQQRQITALQVRLDNQGAALEVGSQAEAIAAQGEQLSDLATRLNGLEAATATLAAQATPAGQVAGATVINQTELDQDRGVIGSITAVVAEWTDTGFMFIKEVIFRGAVLFEGPVAFFNDTVFNGRLIVGNHDTAGVIEFYPGQTEAEITFDQVYDLKPIVTLTVEGEPSLATQSATFYNLTNVTQQGFRVMLNSPVPSNEVVTINWHALGTAEPNITQVGAPAIVATGSGQVAGAATGSGQVGN